MPSAINGMNQGVQESYAISRAGAAQAYQPTKQAEPVEEKPRLSSTQAPAFEAQLSSVPNQNDDSEKQVQSIRQKLYQGVELSTEEMDFIEEHDDSLYNKAQEAENVRRELRNNLDNAGSAGEAQAIVQQAARAVAQGMSSAGAITTARENTQENINAISGNNNKDAIRAQQSTVSSQAVIQQNSNTVAVNQPNKNAAIGSISAANPAPAAQSAQNQAVASRGSVTGSAVNGSISDVIQINAAKGKINAKENSVALQETGNSAIVENVTAPQQNSPNAIEQNAGVLTAAETARSTAMNMITNNSVLSDITAASAGNNPTIVNQNMAGGAGITSAASTGGAAVQNIAIATEQIMNEPSATQNNVAAVSSAPTVAERISTGEIGQTFETSKTATPAEQQIASQVTEAKPMAGTGKTNAAVDEQEARSRRAAAAQQAMIRQREANSDAKAARAEAERRSEERIKRFMDMQNQDRSDDEPSRAVVNARAVRRTWEQFANNQNYTRQDGEVMALANMNNRVQGQLRSYSKMTDIG